MVGVPVHADLAMVTASPSSAQTVLQIYAVGGDQTICKTIWALFEFGAPIALAMV